MTMLTHYFDLGFAQGFLFLDGRPENIQHGRKEDALLMILYHLQYLRVCNLI